jgi:hypothetical protein
MQKNKTILLWDADSLCYKHKSTDTLQKAIKKIDDCIKDVLAFSKADGFCMCVSRGKYFRHNISNTYKANRGTTVLPWIEANKEYLIAKYKAVHFSALEADDVIKYFYKLENLYFSETSGELLINPNEKSNLSFILVSQDKDLLKSIEGRHINPNKKTGKDTWEIVWTETSKNEAILFEWQAMIIGDTADNITGLPGKGPAWTEKYINNIKDLKEIINIIFFEYLKTYGVSNGIYNFQKNYRHLHILENEDDFIREVSYIPEPSKLNINFINIKPDIECLF